MNLLIELQKEFNLSYLFIAHDLAVVKHVSDRIAIMYLGRLVEEGPGQTIYEKARHPYTQSLISAIPVPDPRHHTKRQVLTGDVPSPINPPAGCAFHPRCPRVMGVCKTGLPELIPVKDAEASPGQRVACYLYQ
jgi:oligopeptide/dipeptide ABC transporter ATP-binding protein